MAINPIVDNFAQHTQGLESPYTNGLAATLSDSVDHPNVTRALYVGTTGDIKVTLTGNMPYMQNVQTTQTVGAITTAITTKVSFPAAPITLKNVQAGTILKIRCQRIWLTGTTAANLVLLW